MPKISKDTKLLCFLLPFVLLGLWAQTKSIESYRLQQPLEVTPNRTDDRFNGVRYSTNTSIATALSIEIIQGNHSLPANRFDGISGIEKDEGKHNNSIGNEGILNTTSTSTSDTADTTGGNGGRTKNDGLEPRTKERKLLTCEEIENLEIVRQIGKGMSKTVFEVKLPGSRGNAIAKRIHRNEKKGKYLNLVKKESHYLEKLQNMYGVDDTLGFFGECQATKQSLIEKLRRDGVEDDVLMRNFSIGYTAILEMGTPLLPEMALINQEGHQCHQDARKCFGNHFTESDVEDLAKIARQYANFEGRIRLIMRGKTRDISDNCKPEQYVMTANGLRHIDLEMVYSCKRKNCSYDEALEINCSMMRLLVNNPELDCRTPTPKELRREPRINTTAALEECSALFPTTFVKKRTEKKNKRKKKKRKKNAEKDNATKMEQE